MNRMIRFHLFVFPGAPLCLAVLMLLVACASTAATSDLPTATHTPDATSLPAVFFFRQKKDPNIYTQALMEGELVLVDDCLRIGGADGHVPIWPWDFALETGDSDVRVVGADGRVVAEIGDRLRISGGEVPAMPVVEDAARPLLANCPGPYWAVGNEIERVALMASPTSAEPPVSCTAEPSRKTTSPIPTGTPPPSPTAAGLGVSVGTEPGLPQILSEGTLDCVPTGSLAHCVDDVLSIEFDIPASWGSVKTKLLAGGYTGHAYYYYFGGKTDAGPKDLVAGGLSANYSSGGRGAMPTDFWGYEDADWHRASACAGSGDRFGNSYPICREVSDHVAWMIRFPSAEVLCPHGFYAWETAPAFRIEVNLPDNPKINGFVFEAAFFSRAFADQVEAELYPLLGIQAGFEPRRCDEASRQAFDRQLAALIDSIMERTADAETIENVDELIHFAESIVVRERDDNLPASTTATPTSTSAEAHFITPLVTAGGRRFELQFDSWSPDGEWIAYWRREGEDGFPAHLVFVHVDTGVTCWHEEVNAQSFAPGQVIWGEDSRVAALVSEQGAALGGFVCDTFVPVDNPAAGDWSPTVDISPDGRYRAETRLIGWDEGGGQYKRLTIVATAAEDIIVTIPYVDGANFGWADQGWLDNELYLVGQTAEQGVLYVSPSEGKVGHVIPDFFGLEARATEDGALVHSQVDATTGEYHLLLQQWHPDTGKLPALLYHSELDRVEELAYYDAWPFFDSSSFTPDGHWLLLGSPVAAGQPGPTSSYWLRPVDPPGSVAIEITARVDFDGFSLAAQRMGQIAANIVRRGWRFCGLSTATDRMIFCANDSVYAFSRSGAVPLGRWVARSYNLSRAGQAWWSPDGKRTVVMGYPTAKGNEALFVIHVCPPSGEGILSPTDALRPPAVFFERILDCTAGERFSHCADEFLNLEFDIPSRWPVIETRFGDGAADGFRYDYLFGGKSLTEPSSLRAGGRSIDFAEQRGATQTDFSGYGHAEPQFRKRGCDPRWAESMAVCVEVTENVAWMIRFPKARLMCEGDSLWPSRPAFRIEVNLPDNRAIQGFVFEAPFWSERFATQMEKDLYPLLGKCDELSRQAFDAQRMALIESIINRTADAETLENVDELLHLAESIMVRERENNRED